jgi:Fic family protein
MNVADQDYLKPWLRKLGRPGPKTLWHNFVAGNELPSIDFSNAVSAVYSSNIEGNPIDLNSYLASKFRGRGIRFKAKDRKEIENLESAYRFAQSHALNEKNLLSAHAMLAATLLTKSSLRRYRDQMVCVYSRTGMEYAALEHEHVPNAMRMMFTQIRELRRASLNEAETFSTRR